MTSWIVHLVELNKPPSELGLSRLYLKHYGPDHKLEQSTIRSVLVSVRLQVIPFVP
jgi:hypothetical protein